MAAVPSREQAKEAFNAIAGADGQISLIELRDAMKGGKFDIARIFVDLDKDGDKMISEKEFLEQVLMTPRIQAFKELFDSVDKDKSGSVSIEELKAYLSTSAKGKKLIADVKKLKDGFDAMDTDGSGSISKDEMVKYMDKHY